MTTEQIILVALAVNFVIAVAAIAIPRIRNRQSRAASTDASASRPARTGAPAADSAGARPPSPVTPSRPAVDAGAPWFPGRAEVLNGGLAGGAARESARPSSDAETGLDLRPAWSRWLAEEEARIRRFHRPATIVLVDLSGLERLADRLGPDAATRLIPPIAMTMRRQARATDHLARLGPTLFGAVLTETDEVRAINYVERIRSACDVWLEAGAVVLRLSIGWAEMNTERPAEVALIDAERRLYEERQRSWTVLSRQADDQDVEAAVMSSA